MIKYVPLSAWTAPGIPVEPPFGHLNDIGMVPLNDNEVLLSAHYYPIVVTLDGPRAGIGALLRPDMLARDLIGRNGRWSGAYTPVMLRCFPFRFAATAVSGDPIADLEFGRVPSSGTAPRLLRMREEGGGASRDLNVLYEGVKSVWQGQQRMLPALDILLAADLLVAIRGPAESERASPYYTIDRRRFANTSPHALEAMARNSFTPLDLATAMIFSQAILRPALRPLTATPGETAPAATTAAISVAGDIGAGGIETITPWLDTSELFPGAWAADPSIWAADPGTAEKRAINAPASTRQAG